MIQVSAIDAVEETGLLGDDRAPTLAGGPIFCPVMTGFFSNPSLVGSYCIPGVCGAGGVAGSLGPRNSFLFPTNATAVCDPPTSRFARNQHHLFPDARCLRATSVSVTMVEFLLVASLRRSRLRGNASTEFEIYAPWIWVDLPALCPYPPN